VAWLSQKRIEFQLTRQRPRQSTVSAVFRIYVGISVASTSSPEAIRQLVAAWWFSW